MSTPRHVIFGTGAIGLALLDALRRYGETARLVNRSGHALVPEEVEVIGGDARDRDFTTAVAKGARVVYQTLNPPYTEWTAQFPGLQAGVLAAAEASGARLVTVENIYMYGRPAGRAFTEDRTYDAHTKKGQLRGRMARELLAAHVAGRVEVAIGRASDYFGPRGGAQSNLGDRLFPAALAGKTATVLGDPDQPHTYTYIPDIGEALAVLANTPMRPARCGTSTRPRSTRPWPPPSRPTGLDLECASASTTSTCTGRTATIGTPRWRRRSPRSGGIRRTGRSAASACRTGRCGG